MTQTYYSPVFKPSYAGNEYSSLANWMPEPMKMDTGAFALPEVNGAASAATPSLWGNIQGWMNDSGVLGKTLADGTKVQGWGGMALGAASGIMNGWLGLQQLKLAKDAANQSRDQFNRNFAAQSQTLNTQLEDRQRARVASNPTAYQSVGDYMKQNRVGG